MSRFEKLSLWLTFAEIAFVAFVAFYTEIIKL